MNKKVLAYIAVPAAFTIILIGTYLLGGSSLWKMELSDFKLAVVKGAPEYTYETMQSDIVSKTKEEGLTGEVKTPLSGTMFGEIKSEEVGLKAPLYYGDSEEILEKGVGLYTGGHLPGESGTILLGGHDTTFMAPLEQIKIDSQITIATTYGTFQYQVTEMKALDVMDESAYDLNKSEENLILYTCYPFGKVTANRSGRYYVYAKRISQSQGKGEN